MPSPEARRLPFGVGVLVRPDDGDANGDARSGPERDEEPDAGRLVVAMAACEAGYFLLDIVEVTVAELAGTVPGREGERLWRLVVRTEAQALFVRGPVDVVLLEPMAAELRLAVRVVEDDTSAASGELAAAGDPTGGDG